MSLGQAVALGVLYWLANSSLPAISYYTLYRPMVGGAVAGLILGDVTTGVIVGATINMMFIGFISAGGSLPSDMPLAGILGTALAITGDLSVEAALAVAVPLGLLGTLVWFAKLALNSVFNRWIEALIAKGSLTGLWLPAIIIPQLLLFLITGVPCAIVCYVGTGTIVNVLNFLGGDVLSVLTTIGGLMPALGIAVTLKFIFKGENRVFLFLGFLLAAYTDLSSIGIGLFALVAATVYTQATYASTTSGDMLENDLSLNLDDLAENEATLSENALDTNVAEANAASNEGIAPTAHERFTPTKKLSSVTLFKSWATWQWSYQACYNYENMQAATFLCAMAPVLKELYADNPEEMKRAMARHFEFFNMEGVSGAGVLGLIVAMEEQRASGQELSEEAIRSVRTGLMGSLSGLGDSAVQGTIIPIMLSIAIPAAAEGNAFVVLLYVLAVAAIYLGLVAFFFYLGYRQGSNAIIEMLEGGTFKKVIFTAGILGCTVLGGLIVNFVSVSCPLVIADYEIQTALFDAIVPGLLPLLVTMFSYWLIRRGWSSPKVLAVLVLIGIVGNLTGVLA